MISTSEPRCPSNSRSTRARSAPTSARMSDSSRARRGAAARAEPPAPGVSVISGRLRGRGGRGDNRLEALLAGRLVALERVHHAAREVPPLLAALRSGDDLLG